MYLFPQAIPFLRIVVILMMKLDNEMNKCCRKRYFFDLFWNA